MKHSVVRNLYTSLLILYSVIDYPQSLNSDGSTKAAEAVSSSGGRPEFF